MILKQKQGGKRKEFEIQNDSTLRVKEKESGELKEWTVNLENKIIKVILPLTSIHQVISNSKR